MAQRDPHDELRTASRLRGMRKNLRELTRAVAGFLDALDAEMKQPASVERGRRIAVLCNGLNLANDAARHFGLGEKLRRRS